MKKTRLFFLLVHSVLQALASLEDRILGSRDLDLSPRLGIAALTRSACLDFEGPEADHLDFVLLDQRLFDAFEERVDSLLGVLLRQLRLLRNPIALFFGALALPLRKDQPMDVYLAAIISFILKPRSEEHTSELQSRINLVCRLLLEKKKH